MSPSLWNEEVADWQAAYFLSAKTSFQRKSRQLCSNRTNQFLSNFKLPYKVTKSAPVFSLCQQSWISVLNQAKREMSLKLAFVSYAWLQRVVIAAVISSRYIVGAAALYHITLYSAKRCIKDKVFMAVHEWPVLLNYLISMYGVVEMSFHVYVLLLP